MLLPLAQLPTDAIGAILVTGLIVIGMAMVGRAVVMMFKRKVQGPDNTTPAAFSLDDLRRLHDAGQLTDEEYEKAKQVIFAATEAHLQRKTTGGPSQSDLDLAKARSRAKDR